jgi:hypothetical protein
VPLVHAAEERSTSAHAAALITSTILRRPERAYMFLSGDSILSVGPQARPWQSLSAESDILRLSGLEPARGCWSSHQQEGAA